jgi:hypothetical protein
MSFAERPGSYRAKRLPTLGRRDREWPVCGACQTAARFQRGDETAADGTASYERQAPEQLRAPEEAFQHIRQKHIRPADYTASCCHV